MTDLRTLTDFGRKQWTKRKWDEYQLKPVAKAIELAEKAYYKPTAKEWDCKIDKAKWKTTIDRKVNYLLARKPLLAGAQEALDELSEFIKETAREYLLRGSLIWLVQGDGESLEKKPYIMDDTIAIYTDKNKEETIGYIRKYTDIELEQTTGEEVEVEYYELYYGNKRDTYCFTKPEADVIGEELDEPLFIELGHTEDEPLYAYVEKFLWSFDKALRHQDTTTEKNTDPIVEIRGYTGTPDEDIDYAVNTAKIIKTDGTGGVTIHQRSMDSTAMELWRKAVLQEYYEATATVGKDNELAYAQSGKAMDRLFIDMENSAKELAHVLEIALMTYFNSIGIDGNIVWNTDRPVDDVSIIQGIATSKGLLSNKTLLEQHPWVEDVDEEIARLTAEGLDGFEDLIDNEEGGDERWTQ